MTIKRMALPLSLALLLAACAQLPTRPAPSNSALVSTPNDLGKDWKEYTAAIYKAAVKQPWFQQVRLTPIPSGQPSVSVITFATRSPLGANDRLDRDTWVSLPDKLQAHCEGHANAVLALEQILGMPPTAGDWALYRFTVSPEEIFRPCASGGSVYTSQCSFDLPKGQLETKNFVFNQMWTSFMKNASTPGYPFTGMGWTYDWDPESKTHVGVSEYVVKKYARATELSVLQPAQFCSASH